MGELMRGRIPAVLVTAAVLCASQVAITGPAEARTRVPVFRSCAELNKKFPSGVGLAGSGDRTKRGRTPVTAFRIDKRVYLANRRLDRDRDGIACERLVPMKVGVRLAQACRDGRNWLWAVYDLTQTPVAGGPPAWLEDQGHVRVVEVLDDDGPAVPFVAHSGGEGWLFLKPEELTGSHFDRVRVVFDDGRTVVRSAAADVTVCP